jgi:hypothetical protein
MDMIDAMKPRLLTCMMIAALVTSACSSTLRVSKDGRAFALGSRAETGYKILCASGDLLRVLHDTTLPPELKDALTQSLCSAERSPEKAKLLYSAMTDEQQKDLRQSFERSGYDLSMACG